MYAEQYVKKLAIKICVFAIALNIVLCIWDPSWKVIGRVIRVVVVVALAERMTRRQNWARWFLFAICIYNIVGYLVAGIILFGIGFFWGPMMLMYATVYMNFAYRLGFSKLTKQYFIGKHKQKPATGNNGRGTTSKTNAQYSDGDDSIDAGGFSTSSVPLHEFPEYFFRATGVELSDAICTYLGGDPESGAIMVAGGVQRLMERYRQNNPMPLHAQLEGLLERLWGQIEAGQKPEGQELWYWLSRIVPDLSVPAIKKLDAHFIDRLNR